jgi:ABC-2 type transport system permease protein
VAIKAESHMQRGFLFRSSDESTVLARFGEMTASTALQSLTPLLIILLTFGSFVMEREAGTMRLALSAGVSRQRLLLGKALSYAAAFSLLLLPVILLGVATLLLTKNVNPLDNLERLGMMSLGYFLYFGAFLWLSLAVSAVAPSARLALVLLAGFWIASNLFLPRLTAEIADRLYPIPSTKAFLDQIYKERYEGRPQRAEELKKKAFAQYGVNGVEDLPIYLEALHMQVDEEHGNKVLAKHWNALWGAYERQERLQLYASIIVPALAIKPFSAAMAGTDLAHHRDFFNAAESYRQELVRELNMDLLHKVRVRNLREGLLFGEEWGEYKSRPELWRRTVDFQYTPPGIGSALGTRKLSLGILFAHFALTGGAAIWAARRMSTEARP